MDLPAPERPTKATRMPRLDRRGRRPRAPRARRDRRSARPRSGSGRARRSSVSGPSRMVFSASKSMKTRSSAAAPCCTVAKLPPSRRAGPAMTPRPVRRPVKSAMVMVPARMRRPTTKSRIATAMPTSTSISGATRACQRFWRLRRPKSRSKSVSALSDERLLQPVGARHADAREALGDLGGHRGDLGLGALGEAPQAAADAVDRDERQREDEADAERSAASRSSASPRWSPRG